MNEIILTKEHKERLLEMCNKLLDDNFEYTNFRFMPVVKKGFFKKEIIETNFIQWISQANGNVTSIHWFELVCSKMFLEELSKTLEVKEKFNIKDFYGESVFNQFVHPVDYLYERFQKINFN